MEEINNKSYIMVQKKDYTQDESNQLGLQQSANNYHHFRIKSQEGLPPVVTERRTNYQET